MLFLNLILGIIIGVILTYLLTSRKPIYFIFSVISGVLGAFIGQMILEEPSNLILKIFPSLIGSVCLSILVLFFLKTISDLKH